MTKKTSLAAVRQRKIALCAAVFLIPVIILMAVYILYPIIATFVNSFTQWNGISTNKKFIGFYNWNKLIPDTKF